MNPTLGEILGLKKREWRCNVIDCTNKVLIAGSICSSCEMDAETFRSQQESMDEWFRQFTSSEELGCLLNQVVYKNEAFDTYMTESLKRLLHQRDERVADLVNKNWTKRKTLNHV